MPLPAQSSAGDAQIAAAIQEPYKNFNRIQSLGVFHRNCRPLKAMYEDLIAFLLGKKEEFTDDDLDEFIDLLNKALEITEEYDIHRKQSIIENMVAHTNVKDGDERAIISTAIDNILQLDDFEGEAGLLEDKEEARTPLRSRKFTRGRARAAQPAREAAAESQSDAATQADGVPATEPSSFVEQEDLLKSLNSDARMQENAGTEKPKVKFSELFAKKAASGAAAAPKATLGKSAVPPAKRQKELSTEEYKFDIGELEEENHYEGPDFVFNSEDSE